MKKINSVIAKIAIISALGAFAACQTNTTQNTGQTNQPANSKNVAAVNAAPTATPPIEETNRSETTIVADQSPKNPTETYKFAYAARKNKDLDGLKRVMSKDMREFLMMMNGGESFDDLLLQMNAAPQAATDESRNEKITGNAATLEYPDKDGKWKTMDFVKEDGEWKITLPEGNVEDRDAKPKATKR